MKVFQLPIDWLSYCFASCILMGTVMRDDTSQHPHRLPATQPVRPIATTTWSPRIAALSLVDFFPQSSYSVLRVF